MADPYHSVKSGRLTFKGGSVATLSKSIHKNKNKKKKQKQEPAASEQQLPLAEEREAASVGENVYTIDAAKKMNYQELFPVEAKKFGYDPKAKEKAESTVEQALDDRVKKKADRYCK